MAIFDRFFNYDKPGPGVEKDEKRSPAKIFFQVLGRKFWKMIQANLLYMLVTSPLTVLVLVFFRPGIELPATDAQLAAYTVQTYVFYILAVCLLAVVGFAPITIGFARILNNYAKEQHAFIWSDFWGAVKENFKKTIIVGVADLVIVFVLAVDILFYSQMAAGSVFMYISQIVVIATALVWFIMHFYLYPLLLDYQFTLKQALRNSFLLALGHLPFNLLICLIIAVLVMLCFSFQFVIGEFITVLILPAVISLVVNFMALRVMKKYFEIKTY